MTPEDKVLKPYIYSTIYFQLNQITVTTVKARCWCSI